MIDKLFSQERRSIIVSRQRKISENQREESLMAMHTRQREMMQKESKQIKDKDDQKVQEALKATKGSKHKL